MKAAGPSTALAAEQFAAADAGQKAFMPVGGRPFLDYLVDALAAADVREIALVVADEGVRANLSVRALTLVVQREPLGTAHAVLCARDWAGDEPFLVMNGDNLYPSSAIEAVSRLDGPGLAGFDRDDLIATSNIGADRISAFAALERDESGNLKRIVEKPSDAELAALPSPVLLSMNLWRFDVRIFDACRDVPPSPRGELELPAAVMLARGRGVPFLVVPSRGPVLDLSQRSDIAEVSRRLSGEVR